LPSADLADDNRVITVPWVVLKSAPAINTDTAAGALYPALLRAGASRNDGCASVPPLRRREVVRDGLTPSIGTAASDTAVLLSTWSTGLRLAEKMAVVMKLSAQSISIKKLHEQRELSRKIDLQ